MIANKDIETGIAAGLKITVNSVIDRKIYLTLQNETGPILNERAILDLDKLKWQEHMGKQFLQIDTEHGEIIFLPVEKWEEIGKWIAEETKRRDVIESGQNSENKT